MPDQAEQTSVQLAWLGFIGAIRPHLGSISDDRPLDQYLDFRDAVLKLVQRDQFLKDLDLGWSFASNEPAIREALLLEIQAGARAAEVARETSRPDEAKKQQTHPREIIDCDRQPARPVEGVAVVRENVPDSVEGIDRRLQARRLTGAEHV